MSTYFIRFLRPIALPDEKGLKSIAFDGTRIYATNLTGDKIYLISNSGTLLNNYSLTQQIDYIAYDRLNLNLVGYSLATPNLLLILDNNFNTVNTVELQYDVENLGEVKDITYNLQSDTITVVHPKDSNAIDDSGAVINNIHLKHSSYTTSNVSGAYIFNGVVNGTQNYITKTDLAGNILQYYRSPNNMTIESLAIQGADIYRTTYYALMKKGSAYYLANLCFANPIPDDFTGTSGANTYGINTRGVFGNSGSPYYNYSTGAVTPASSVLNPYGGNYRSAAVYGSDIIDDNPFSRLPIGILARDGLFGRAAGTNERTCPTLAAFFTYATLMVCNWEDARDYCGVLPEVATPEELNAYNQCIYTLEREIASDNFELTLYVTALIIAVKTEQAKKRKAEFEINAENNADNEAACCPNFDDAAFYENTQSLNFTDNIMGSIEGFNYGGSNPLL